MNGMITTTITLDGAGRLVLPKPMRDELQLAAGDSLEVESFDDQIVLRPVRGTGSVHKEQGLLVLHTGAPLSADAVDRTLRRIRNERGRVSLSSFRSTRGKSVQRNPGKPR